MAKEIVTEIMIEGEKLAHFSSAIIKQQFNNHHAFEVVVSHDVIEKLGAHTLETSQDFMGKSINIAFGETSTADNVFKGIITEVGMRQSQGLWGNVVIKGYSPTYLLESGAHYESYYKRSLSNIVSKITGEMSAHDMQIRVSPKFTDTIPYITQYKESHFAFINRLAAEYGEWFYYNGSDLYFGKPSGGTAVDLLYGANIEDLNFSMRVIPTKVDHYSYNSSENNTLKSKSPDSVEGANSYMKRALEVADTLYQKPVIQPAAIRTPDKGQLDKYAEQQKAAKAAATVVLTAYGDCPKVKLGGLVKVKVIQKEVKSKETQEHGEYTVTSITHNLEGTGTYAHTFEAIPSSSTAVPFQVQAPQAETQVAVVKDNADPESKGRVRVEMLWQKEKGGMTDWIRVLTPDGGSSGKVGKNRGFVFIPEVGDEVLVGFRYNDPNRPFVMGSMFHGKIAGGGGAGNNIKTIYTKSGNMLQMNDAEGSITTSDPSGNTIVMDGKGNITISSTKSITLKSKDISILATNNLILDGTENVLGSSKLIGMTATDDFIAGAKTVSVHGSDVINITSPKAVNVNGKKTTIDGQTISVSGKGDVGISGGLIKLNS